MENNTLKKYFDNLYKQTTPLVFTDGTEIYNNLKKEYVTHEKGYFIYGPSGVEKHILLTIKK